MSDPTTELLLVLYETHRATAYSNLFVGIIFGVYVVLYGTSLYILLRKDGVLRSAPRLFMFVVTTAMFALGLTALALDTTLAFQQFARELSPFSVPGSASSSPSWSVRRANIVTAVGATIACTIYVLSDVVCAWRAAVLWNYDRRVVAVLAFFVLGTTAAAGSDLGFTFRPLFKPSSDQLGLTQDGNSAKLDDHRVLILVGPTLATNVLSTSLIGVQVWRNRRVLISHLSRNSVAIRAEKVLAMLVESGFVYCCIWVLYLISTFQVLPKPGFAVMDAILPYIAGLYPTMVVIFIVLRKSPTFTITKRPASMHVYVSDPPHYATVERRIPVSILYPQNEETQTHADSDKTALPSPALHPMNKQ